MIGELKKKSRPGTTFMGHEKQKNHLTARDICNIIKTSGKSGLKKLVYQDLHLEFSDTTAEIVDLQTGQTLPIQKDISQLSFESLGELDSPAIESVDEIQDMHLAVTDPVAWEKSHLEGNDYAAQNEHNEA